MLPSQLEEVTFTKIILGCACQTENFDFILPIFGAFTPFNVPIVNVPNFAHTGLSRQGQH